MTPKKLATVCSLIFLLFFAVSTMADETEHLQSVYHLLRSSKTLVRVPKTVFDMNEAVSVTLTNMAGFDDDWVGIYPAGADNSWDNHVAWAPTNGIKSGPLTIPMTEVPSGLYEARIFFKNSFTLEAKCSFLIYDSPTLALPVYKDDAIPDELTGEWHGAMGERPVRKISIPSPWPAYKDMGNLKVDLYFPGDISQKRPTVFFIAGWHVHNSTTYYSLLYFIASQGYNCVFIPYNDTDPDADSRRNLLPTILDSVVEQFDSIIDTTRVGYAGHSEGGGLAYYLARERAEWGTNGRFIFSLAAWWGFHLPATGNVEYPANTNLIVQVNEEDAGTDPRQNIDLLLHNNIPDERKTYLYLPSDAHHIANHSVSYSPVVDGKYTYDALEQVGLYRPLESLMGYSFKNDTRWKQIGLPDQGDEKYNTFSSRNGISVYLGDNPMANDAVSIPAENNLDSSFLCRNELNPRYTMCMPCGDTDRNSEWSECQYNNP